MRIISISYYLAALVMATYVVSNASAAVQEYGALYRHFSPSEQVDLKLKSFLESLTLGLYTGATDRNREVNEIVLSAQSHDRRADASAWLLFGLSICFVIVKTIVYKPTRKIVLPKLAQHLLGVSMVFLSVGLLAPILSLVAYTDIAVLGKVVFKFESKGILSTVMELLDSGNWFIAVVLFTFSVLTPIIKLIVSVIAIAASDPAVRHRYVSFISAIGKWSMADVMVVAILLSFFVAGSDQFTDSWLGPGLYFFTGYCLLSLAITHLIPRLEERTPADGPCDD